MTTVILYAVNCEIMDDENYNAFTKAELQLNPELINNEFNENIRSLENKILTNLPNELEELNVQLVMEKFTNIENLEKYYLFNNLPINLKKLKIITTTYNLNNAKNDISIIRQKIESNNFKIPYGCSVYFIAFRF
jgi:hypothetical protein